MSRLGTELALLLALVSGCVECYGAGASTVDPPAHLRVVTVPAEARVRVDEETVLDGRVTAVEPVRLRVGAHQLSIEAEGHFPHDMTVELPSGETTVEVRLRPLPP